MPSEQGNAGASVVSTETMRWLDRWIGVPLCFLLSLLAGGATRRARHPHRVLCIQLAEMGSLVLAAPAIRWMQGRGLASSFVSFRRNGHCIDIAGLAAADRVFLWRTESTFLFGVDLFRFLAWAWRQDFDAAIDFEPCSRFSALLGLLSGARLRVGYAQPAAYRGRLHTLPVAYRADRHMGENCLALATALLPGAASPAWQSVEADWVASLPVAIAAQASRRVDLLLRARFPTLVKADSLVLINPNAGDLLPQRRWPADRYLELCRRLLANDPGLCIGLIGGDADTASNLKLARCLASPRCASLAGELAVAELPALFARCRLLVSNDSGPAHIAALTRTPTLVMFGPETPALYRPLGAARALYAGLSCSPCIRVETQRRCACADNQCMQAISVDRVAGEILGMFSETPSPIAVLPAPTLERMPERR